jgi:hypothetical protein
LAPRNEKISGEGMSQISWQKKEQISWQITVTCIDICPFSASLFVTKPLLKLREGIAYG